MRGEGEWGGVFTKLMMFQVRDLQPHLKNTFKKSAGRARQSSQFSQAILWQCCAGKLYQLCYVGFRVTSHPNHTSSNC